MANLSISDTLLHKIEAIAEQTGQSPEEVITNALAELDIPLNTSATLKPLLRTLAELRQQAEKEIAQHGITVSDEIIKDRGD
jgi:predicted transcriptional regulator